MIIATLIFRILPEHVRSEKNFVPIALGWVFLGLIEIAVYLYLILDFLI